MTNNTQILFNRAVAHVRQQGEPAMGDDDPNSCQLLNHEGLQCAVGGLINKDLVTKEMETQANPRHPHSHDVRYAIQKSNPDLDLDVHNREHEYWAMLGDLQQAHDDASAQEAFLATFNENVEEMRGKYGLEAPT